MSWKTGDLDLDLQGQIGLETSQNFSFNFFIHNVIHDFKIGDLELDIQGQIGLQTSEIFILTVKH